ncbi:undecaprenyl-diphosphatase [Humitalea rosea]|uniref:Undecaprenyl-diphosphatase n=1 Tax=Humitalea rosea TaxID=990373 RepID=A0A2W7I7U5_9PROT|nr:bifunctional DedA family/phosphatase PAP2 family protein [Humitalea rosea]PZW43011.1 undecaprenyl-diphosphatase [Humitalea rosea]
MSGLIASATHLVAAHPHWAAAVAFLLAAAESLAIIGALVPGTPIIVAIGALVALGHLNLWAILAATAAGAVAGDGVSYWIGHRYREGLRKLWPFSRRPELLARAEAHFRQHGIRSILVARFVPVIRSTVPVAAGMLGMAPGRFYAANIASALVWAPAHVLPGVLAGTVLAGLGAVSLRLGLAAAILLLLVLGALWVARGLAVLGLSWFGAGRQALAGWAAARGGIAGHLGRYATAAEHADLRRGALLAALAGGATLGFLVLLEDVAGRETIVRVDAAVLGLVGSLHTEWTDPVMLAATRLGDTVMNVLVSALIVGWLLLRRQFRLAAGVLVAILGAAAAMTAIKLGVQAGRPPLLTPIAPGFSFPSGHSSMAAVTLGLLGWLVAAGAPGRWRRPVLGAITVLIALIAFSRIYLAAHWPSDVVGGLLLGLIVVSGLAAWFGPIPPRAVAPMPLVGLVAAALLLVGGARIATHIGPDLAVLQANALRPLPLPAPWREGGWRSVAAYRSDLGGEDEEPFLLQWQGDAASLAAALGDWQKLPPWSLANVAQVLGMGGPAMALPALPVMDRGVTPLLILARPDGAEDRRLVLRAWRSGREDPAAPGHPLLVVSVTRETVAPIAGLLWLPRPAGERACPSIALGLPTVPTGRMLTPRDGGCGGVLRLGPA